MRWHRVSVGAGPTRRNRRVESPGGGHDPEFVEWRWEPMKNLPELVVPFKRDTYEQVVKAFFKFAK